MYVHMKCSVRQLFALDGQSADHVLIRQRVARVAETVVALTTKHPSALHKSTSCPFHSIHNPRCCRQKRLKVAALTLRTSSWGSSSHDAACCVEILVGRPRYPQAALRAVVRVYHIPCQDTPVFYVHKDTVKMLFSLKRRMLGQEDAQVHQDTCDHTYALIQSSGTVEVLILPCHTLDDRDAVCGTGRASTTRVQQSCKKSTELMISYGGVSHRLLQ